MTEPRPADRALLRLLQRQGRVSDAEAGRLTDLAAQSGLSIHELLEREGVLTGKALAALLATTLHLNLVDWSSVRTDPDVAGVLSESMAAQYGVVPVRIEGGTLEVATANPLDFEALKALEFITGHRVRPLVATRAEILGGPAERLREEEPTPENGSEPPSPAMPADVSPAEFEPVPAAQVAPEAVAAPESPAWDEPRDLVDELPPVVATQTEIVGGPAEPHRGEESSPEERSEPPQPAMPPDVSPGEYEHAPLSHVVPEAITWPEASATDELRGLIAAIRDEQQAAAAETRAAVAAVRLVAQQALDRAAAAGDALREQIADLRREQGVQARAADDAAAEATRARQAADEALGRIDEATRRPPEPAEGQEAIVRLSGELAELRSMVEDAVVLRLAAAEGAVAEVGALRKRVDELARPEDPQQGVAARAAADAARAMEQADKALRRLGEAMAPLRGELNALRASCGELRASHARLESTLEQRLGDSERRSASLIAARVRSMLETIEELKHWHEAQKVAAGNARLEAALTRQQASEALRRTEAITAVPSADDLREVREGLESLRAEHLRFESCVEERSEARIRKAADVIAAELQELRAGIETLGARLREVAAELRWVTSFNALYDRLTTVTGLPSRVLARLIAR